MKEICGIEKEIIYDKKISKLNIELAKDEMGSPVIIFQDWSGRKSKNLLVLHIKEAIELKAMIDVLVVDYLESNIQQ